MLEIDGSQGEGGGQIIRSALALSMVTGRDIALHNIRAGRSKPGLRQQHKTCVEAAIAVCDAQVSGHAIGSDSLTFAPGTVRCGEYNFRVGTAGSTTLVLQTILPALITASGPSTVIIEGGTHNPWAPPFDFLQAAYLPLLNQMGPRVSVELQRHGFFPTGGGRLKVCIAPAAELTGFTLCERGTVRSHTVRALIADLPTHIADRELDTIRRRARWKSVTYEKENIDRGTGPGNVVFIEVHSEALTEVFCGFGRQGVPAERVAKDTFRQTQSYLDADVPVGPYLADQLMLPLGLSAYQRSKTDLGGGGAYRTMKLTDHSLTHMTILKSLLDIPVSVAEIGDDACEVQIGQQYAEPA